MFCGSDGNIFEETKKKRKKEKKEKKETEKFYFVLQAFCNYRKVWFIAPTLERN